MSHRHRQRSDLNTKGERRFSFHGLSAGSERALTEVLDEARETAAPPVLRLLTAGERKAEREGHHRADGEQSL